jgi:oxygen-independent coproporphyrinogen-3 oxidase
MGRSDRSWGGSPRLPSDAEVSHLYVHLPFCRTLCSYCDFASETIGRHERDGALDRYVSAVLDEAVSAQPALRVPLDTVYVGGGTPTELPRDLLSSLLDGLSHLAGVDTESTIEANPETVDGALLDLLRDSGVTRLSLGVQSFQDPLLSTLGRKVPAAAALAAIEEIRRARWDDWSLDLVFGIPGQDLAALEADLEAAVEARPPHISVYDLTYTERFDRRVESRLGPGARAAAEDLAEAHYHVVHERLAAAGYERYEVSNYGLPGYRCRHNLGYWRGDDYVGLGSSAVSTVGERRWTNAPTVAGYLAGEPVETEILSEQVRAFERVMLGLRTSEGVPENEVLRAADAAALERYLSEGLLERRYTTLRLSPRGLDLGNAVLAAILRSPEEASSAPGGP